MNFGQVIEHNIKNHTENKTERLVPDLFLFLFFFFNLRGKGKISKPDCLYFLKYWSRCVL